MCSICCIWFPSRDESSVGFNSCCLVTGGVQTFIAVLLFPTCTSVAQRRRSFHDGHAAQAWKENGLELCSWWDTVSSSKGWKSGIGKQKQPWLIQTPCHNHVSWDELVHILEFHWWPTSVLRSGACFRKVSSGLHDFMSLLHTQRGRVYNNIYVHFECLR